MFKKSDDSTKPMAEPEPMISRPPAPRVSPPSNAAVIGRSIIIKGEVTGQEDLIIEGIIEGRVDLKDQHVTIGPSGRVQAEVAARQVTIEGEVAGNIIASEKVVLTKNGSLIGDIQAARLSVEDGAYLKGTVSLAPREKEKPISLAKPPVGPAAGPMSGPMPGPKPGPMAGPKSGPGGKEAAGI